MSLMRYLSLMNAYVKVAANGRLVLPIEIRRQLATFVETKLAVNVTPEGLVLQTLEQRIAKAQALSRKALAHAEDFTVDDFIAEKRREALREDQEFGD
jgi:bifunctional DNA-binding transcriptional regulator/antitoxin component of YhaV-PrlF toxin-antitoxin module